MNTLDLAALFDPALFDLSPDGETLLGPTDGLGLDATGRRLVINVGSTLHEFDLRDGSRVQEYDLSALGIYPDEWWCIFMRCTPDARVLGAVYNMRNGGQEYTQAFFFDRASGRCIAQPVVADTIVFMDFNPDGELALSGDFYSVSVHRVSDGAELAFLEVDEYNGAAWDPTTGDVIVLDNGVVRALDPLSLEETRRFPLPPDVDPRLQESAGRILLRPLPVRSGGGLGARSSLPFASVDLPWGVRLWHDDSRGDERLLWLAEDAESAVMRDAMRVHRLRADAPPERLIDLTRAPDAWIDAAISDDGAVLAWRDDAIIHWKSLLA